MFSNKTIFITGASSGLGRALAIQLSHENVNLLLMARRLKDLEETKRLCKNSQSVLTVACDVTDPLACAEAIQMGIQQFGSVDYLILNAGMSMWANFDDLSNLNILHQMMDINYFGAVNCTYYALPYLKKQHGMIVVISSIQGKIGVPFHTGYSAAKHALQGFFDSLRIELQKTVDILTVLPGWIEGTALKEKAFQEKSQSVEKNRRGALPLDFCTMKIMQAMHKRTQELILPKKYRWIPLLRFIFPTTVDWFIKRKLSIEKTIATIK